jgi:uncharacterized membrane protein YfcA
MNIEFSAWLFAVSLGASALGGTLGMASGIFIVPVLITFGGVDIHAAVAAGIVSVIACSCGSAAPFLRASLTNIRVAIVLEVATTLGALTGVLLAGVLPVPFLFLLFAVVLLLSAWQMMARRREPTKALQNAGATDWATALRLHSSYPDGIAGRDVSYRVHRIPLGLVLMYGAGLISALLGIGSGVLKIPAMDTALRLPIKVSSATSNFMIGVTAAASAGIYLSRGYIEPGLAMPVMLGVLAGSILGARQLIGARVRVLRWIFAGVVGVMALEMIVTGVQGRL